VEAIRPIHKDLTTHIMLHIVVPSRFGNCLERVAVGVGKADEAVET